MATSNEKKQVSAETLRKYNKRDAQLYAPIPLGRIVCTQAVAELSAKNASFARYCSECIIKHADLDGGKMPPEDVRANIEDVARGCLDMGGGRVISRWRQPTTNGDRDIYIITWREGGEIYTEIMFCTEY